MKEEAFRVNIATSDTAPVKCFSTTRLCTQVDTDYTVTRVVQVSMRSAISKSMFRVMRSETLLTREVARSSLQQHYKTLVVRE